MYVKSRFFLFPSYVSFYRFNLHEHINVFTRVIAVVAYVFLWNFAQESGRQLGKIDPFAHVLRLTAVFTFPRDQGVGGLFL